MAGAPTGVNRGVVVLSWWAMSNGKQRFGYRVVEGEKFSLRDIPTDDKGPFSGRDDPAMQEQLAADLERLAELQEKLLAEERRSVLVVLQAMDTAGKDGLLRKVVGPLDSRGVNVQTFKAPSHEELAHDYLWRVHQRTPARGHMTFFNRSHYEDVLVVRVMGIAPRDVWERRYRHINEFERMLVDSGTQVVKLYLHISRQEQKRRLQERLDDPTKHWKFDPGDLVARSKWDDYMRAYEEALSRCSTDHAPWWIIPADRKWYRDLAVARILVELLEKMDPRHPRHDLDVSKIVIPD